jgi:hypothetical protein
VSYLQCTGKTITMQRQLACLHVITIGLCKWTGALKTARKNLTVLITSLTIFLQCRVGTRQEEKYLVFEPKKN